MSPTCPLEWNQIPPSASLREQTRKSNRRVDFPTDLSFRLARVFEAVGDTVNRDEDGMA